jgi:hypothetical protein
MRKAWTKSPQEVDPLSWFAGPRVPILFSGAAVAQGIVITILYWDLWSSVLLQFLAMPFFLAAGWTTSANTQPDRRQFAPHHAAIALLLAFGGLVVSALGTSGGMLPVTQWWTGIAVAATLVSLSPYSSAVQMIVYSIPAILATGAAGYIVFAPLEHFWSPQALIVISAGPVLIGAVCGVVFSYIVVERTLALLDTSIGSEESFLKRDPEAPSEQLGSIARVSARVAPFLAGVANAGVITPSDRALAAQIARRLRTELVMVTSRSWLDVVAQETGMVVSDPGRLADRMNESQRAALRGLLVAALENSVVDRSTVLVELRAQPDGSTAVALSIDVDLPEGRRLLLLAPYYLTLKTTVDDLSWDNGESLLVKFRIPPSTDEYPTIG